MIPMTFLLRTTSPHNNIYTKQKPLNPILMLDYFVFDMVSLCDIYYSSPSSNMTQLFFLPIAQPFIFLFSSLTINNYEIT